MFVHVYAYMCMYMCAYAHAYTYMHACIQATCTGPCRHHARGSITEDIDPFVTCCHHTHTRTHAYTDTLPARAHTHTHIHTQAKCRALKKELDAFIARRSPAAPKLLVDILGKFGDLAKEHSECPSGKVLFFCLVFF